MTIRIFTAFVWCGLLFFLAIPDSRPQGNTPSNGEKSCSDFVQGFYDWYAPKAFKGNDGRVWELAWHAKATAFSSELLGAFKEDAQAQAQADASNQIDGLDWDPFLSTQVPSSHYETGNVSLKDGKCFVEVYRAASGKKSAKAAVTAELISKDGRWVFGNFHYGKRFSEDDNLLAILRILHPDRHKDSK